MVTRLRALIALLMLVGFYVLVAATVAGLLAVAVLLGSPVGGWFALAAFGVGGAVIVALWRVARIQRSEPAGIPLTTEHAADLWRSVRDLAAAARTRAPDRILLVPELNAAVYEKTRLLGLVGGQRTLAIGLPLMHGLTVAQFSAVLAHEMGHYSHSHTRLSPVVYRGMVSMEHIVERVGRENLAGRLFAAYGRLFLRVAFAVKRRQEVEADRIAVRVGGRDTAAGTLSALPGLGAAWSFFLSRHLGGGSGYASDYASDYAPDAIFAGFRMLLVERPDVVRLSAPEPKRSPWDSHPPIPARVAAIKALPATNGLTDERPATVLLPALAELSAALERMCYRWDGQTVVTWEEYAARVARARSEAHLHGALVRLARSTGRESVSAADLLATAGSDADVVSAAVTACAVRSGVARWRHSWSAGPAVLEGADGGAFDLEGVVGRLTNVHTAESALAELRALGVSFDARVDARPEEDADARVWGAVANVVVDGKRRDVIIYDRALLVVPGSPRAKMRNCAERLEALASAHSLEGLKGAPGSQGLRYEQVARVARGRRSLMGFVLTLVGGLRTTSGGRAFAVNLTMADARVVRLRWGMETVYVGDSSQVLTTVVRQLSEKTESVAASTLA